MYVDNYNLHGLTMVENVNNVITCYIRCSFVENKVMEKLYLLIKRLILLIAD